MAGGPTSPAAKYQRVHSRIWTNAAFREWTTDAKLAALYVLTCPHRNTEGLFRLPMPLAQYELGLDPQRADAAFAELQAHGFIERDTSADLVLLVNALRWNPPRGPKQIAGAVNALAEVPSSPLRDRYLERADAHCPRLAQQIREHLRWQDEPRPDATPDTPSIPHRNGSDTPPIPQAPTRPPALPSQAPRSTQNGTGPDPAAAEQDHDRPPADATPHQITDQAMAVMGFHAAATRTDIDLVTAALNQGWSADQIIAKATHAGTATNTIRRPRQWWASALKGHPPPPRPAEPSSNPDQTPIGPAPAAHYKRTHPENCPGNCSREGWIDLPDGGVARCTGQPPDPETGP